MKPVPIVRKLIFAINMTLDGCVDHRKTGYGGEEMLEYYTKLLREADTEIFGRKTYQLMVPYWPNVAKDPSEDAVSIKFAKTFNALQKVVFSRTLRGVEDKNTRIVRKNLRAEILKLKQKRGKSILVGGVDLSSQLIKLGLVDEYRLVIVPVVAGDGKRLMKGIRLPDRKELKLIDSKAFKSGAIALRYEKQ